MLGAVELSVLCLTCRTGVLPRTLSDLDDFADAHESGVCTRVPVVIDVDAAGAAGTADPVDTTGAPPPVRALAPTLSSAPG